MERNWSWFTLSVDWDRPFLGYSLKPVPDYDIASLEFRPYIAFREGIFVWLFGLTLDLSFSDTTFVTGNLYTCALTKNDLQVF